jgi:hypothetical protein
MSRYGNTVSLHPRSSVCFYNFFVDFLIIYTYSRIYFILFCFPFLLLFRYVYLVPHSHDDVGWLKTIDVCFEIILHKIKIHKKKREGKRKARRKRGEKEKRFINWQGYYESEVKHILDTVVSSLAADPNRTFIYVEQYISPLLPLSSPSSLLSCFLSPSTFPFPFFLSTSLPPYLVIYLFTAGHTSGGGGLTRTQPTNNVQLSTISTKMANLNLL